MRQVARGIHPPVLTDRGLDAALSALAARSPVPVTCASTCPAARRRRSRPSRTSASREALTNVAKHARRRPGVGRGARARRAARRHGAGRRPRRRRPHPRHRPGRPASAGRGRRRHDRRLLAAGRADRRHDRPALRTGRRRRTGPTGGPHHDGRRCASSSPRTRCCCARGCCGCSATPASTSSRPRRRRGVPARRRDRTGPTWSSSTSGCRRRSPTRACGRRSSCASSTRTSPSLVLSQYVEENYATELVAGRSRGVGYLLKDRVADVGEFVEALRRVAAGGHRARPRGGQPSCSPGRAAATRWSG